MQTNPLADMFQRKYDQARTNGATDDQAIKACRGLWLDKMGEDLARDLTAAGFPSIYAKNKGGGQWVQGRGYLSRTEATSLLVS